MKVFVTGAKGFIGHKVSWWLANAGHEVVEFDVGDKLEDFLPQLKDIDFVIHLAGVNRPTNVEDFYKGNYEFTKTVVEFLIKNNINVPLIYSSSSQAELDNDYGKSKKMAEDYLFECPLTTYVYRLDNVFGPGVRPNYNSFVSTMANNIANGLEYHIDDPKKKLTLLNVFKICDEFEKVISKMVKRDPSKILTIPGKEVSLGTVEGLLQLFNKYPYQFPILKDQFVCDLYLAYLSYRPDFVKDLVEHRDERGCFIELVKSPEFGQISINLSRPGITKGNHFHTRKIEDFMTIFGETAVKLRDINKKEIMQFDCDGEKPYSVHIKPGLTHNITNTGRGISLTLMWISEIYNPDDGDTYPEVVENIEE